MEERSLILLFGMCGKSIKHMLANAPVAVDRVAISSCIRQMDRILGKMAKKITLGLIGKNFLQI